MGVIYRGKILRERIQKIYPPVKYIILNIVL